MTHGAWKFNFQTKKEGNVVCVTCIIYIRMSNPLTSIDEYKRLNNSGHRVHRSGHNPSQIFACRANSNPTYMFEGILLPEVSCHLRVVAASQDSQLDSIRAGDID